MVLGTKAFVGEELLRERPVCLANHFGPQLVLFTKVDAVKLELHNHLQLGRSLWIFPYGQMKEHIVAKVFGFDKSEFAIGIKVSNLTNTISLNQVGVVAQNVARVLRKVSSLQGEEEYVLLPPFVQDESHLLAV